MPFTWNADERTYYQNGRPVSQSQLLAFSEASENITGTIFGDTTQQFIDGAINSQRWESEIRQRLKTGAIRQYALGRGGLEQMRPKDWGVVGRWLRDQYGYLSDFADDLDNLTPGQIQARIQMYARSTAAMYWRGSTYYLPRLPNYPKDGQTPCLTNCKCRLEITDLGNGNYEVRWVLSDAEHCTGCIDLAGSWNPLRVENGKIV